MIDSNEITENEAMFRYLNLIDSEESKFNATKNMYFSHYHYYTNDFYVRNTFLLLCEIRPLLLK